MTTKPLIACAYCTAMFSPARVDAAFCGNACRQANHRRRRAAQKFKAAEQERKQAVVTVLAEGPNSTVSAVTERSVLDRLLRRDISRYPAQPVPPAQVTYVSPSHGDRIKVPAGRGYDPWGDNSSGSRERARYLRENPPQPANPGWLAVQQQRTGIVMPAVEKLGPESE